MQAFARPLDNAVATARTCYSSKGIITEDKRRCRERRDALAKSSTRRGITPRSSTRTSSSRSSACRGSSSGPSCTPSVLQLGAGEPALRRGEAGTTTCRRWVRRRGRCTRRRRGGTGRLRAADELLTPVAGEYYSVFPGRRGDGRKKLGGAIQKKAQEVARYVLPVATFAYLYHTVSGSRSSATGALRVLRRPAEQREVVGQMVRRSSP